MLRRARLCHSTSSVYSSVCPSVTFRYIFCTDWNTSKIISRPNSFRYLLTLTGYLVQLECPQNRWNRSGSVAKKPCKKAAISPKWCKMGPRLLWWANRKLHTPFQLVPKSMSLDDLEQPKRHSCSNKKVLQSLPEKFNEDRPILSAAKCRPMILVSRNIR